MKSEGREVGLGELGVDAVAGTRPIINGAGSRRNEAFLWRAATGRAVGVHEKYYLPDEPGYWAVLRHADVVHVSRHPEIFSATAKAAAKPSCAASAGATPVSAIQTIHLRNGRYWVFR